MRDYSYTLQRLPEIIKERQQANGKWYWKKQSYNEYQLVGFHTLLTFPSYDKLHAYCKQHQIDAIQS